MFHAVSERLRFFQPRSPGSPAFHMLNLNVAIPAKEQEAAKAAKDLKKKFAKLQVP